MISYSATFQMSVSSQYMFIQFWKSILVNDEELWCQASGSGSAEPKTRTDSEAKTRKSRLQVQTWVDSFESRVIAKWEKSRCAYAERLVESLFLLAEQDSWSWTTCKFSSGLWACGAFLSQSFASDPSWYFPRLISPIVSETAHWIYILRLHYLQSVILNYGHY